MAEWNFSNFLAQQMDQWLSDIAGRQGMDATIAYARALVYKVDSFPNPATQPTDEDAFEVEMLIRLVARSSAGTVVAMERRESTATDDEPTFSGLERLSTFKKANARAAKVNAGMKAAGGSAASTRSNNSRRPDTSKRT